MFNDNTNNNLGLWGQHNCSLELPSVCMGPVSDENPEPPASKCEEAGFASFTPYKGTESCYWVSNQQMTWADADQACKDKGANLLSVLHWTEQAFVFSYVPENDLWMGLRDLGPLRPYAIWTDGWPMTIHKFVPVEETQGQQPELCGLFVGSDGSWQARRCDETFQFVCKVSKGASLPHPKFTKQL